MRSTAIVLLCVAMFTVPARSQQKPSATPEQSCRKYVQSFYDWYVPQIMKTENTYELVLRGKSPASFSPLLLRQLKEDEAAEANPGEIVGLDFDPFLNSQDPSETFKVTKAKVTADKCSVEVRGISSGVNNEEVHPELLLVNGAWQFVNFRYEQNADLLSMLKSLKAERQKASKSATN